MLVKRIVACAHSIFNILRAIARYWSEIATFSYPLAFNAPVRSGPLDNRGKCYIDRKRIQCLLTASQHVLYLSIFNRFPVIQAVKSIFAHFCTFWPPLGTPLGQSRQILHGSKENLMLIKRLAACTHLSSTVSEI